MKKTILWLVWLLLGAWCSARSVSAADGSDDAHGDRRPHVVLVAYEDEYHAAETLPRFARQLRNRFGHRCTVLQGEQGTGIAGLEQLATADVLVLYVRRHPLPKEQMAMIRRYLEAGKPLVALRTSSHAFSPRGQTPAGLEAWPEFDRDVLGGNYHDHYKAGPRTVITAAPIAAGGPLLTGIQFGRWNSTASLYKVSPLASGTTKLLTGTCGDHVEPVAWTNTYHGGRVFYTSLGDVQDFQTPQFHALLINAIHWVMDKPVPQAP
jgi:type 1 glutamine amidotransferase